MTISIYAYQAHVQKEWRGGGVDVYTRLFNLQTTLRV